MVAENLAQVQKNINESCNKINRDPNEVTLIAVSKTKPVEMLKEAYDAGARVFGENKVQEIVDKYDQMPSDVKWHMIGHLQRNKVKYIVDKVAMIHSVDSFRLAETIEKEAAKKNVQAMIESPRIIATSPATADICDKLELDLVGVCSSTVSTIPDRYKDVETVGTAMRPDM